MPAGQTWAVNAATEAGPTSAAAPRTSGSTWSPAQGISAVGPGQFANEPRVAMSADGQHQTMTWFGTDGVSTNVSVTVSTDAGRSWTTPALLSPSSLGRDANDPRIAMSADGRYQTITWFRSDGSREVVQSRSSSDYGATWAPAVNLSDASQPAMTPQISMSANGEHQTITWRRSNGSNQIIQARVSSDYGATWSTAVDLSDLGRNAYVPAVDMSSDGRYQSIAWYRFNGSNNQIIQARVSSDYGVTWAAAGVMPVDMSDVGQSAADPQIAVSADGEHQTITWYRYDGSRNVIQARMSSDYGATWATAVNLSTPPGSAPQPRLAMSADGEHQTITWYRFNGTKNVVQARSSSDYGASWSTAADLSAPTSNSQAQQVDMSTDGQRQTITWYREDVTDPNIQIIAVSSSDDYGTTWSSAQDLSSPSVYPYAYSPQVAMSADGQQQVVAWYAYNASYTMTVTQASFLRPAAPPAPAPPTPSGPPGDVSAAAGDASASVAWTAPASPGSYPVTHYLVTSSPGAQTCVTSALTCTVTGLTNGTAYTFTVKALTGAGWGANSTPSNAVTPSAPPEPSITITGTRDGQRITVTGTAMHLTSQILRPWLRFPGETSYSEGAAVIPVSANGTFTWSRKTGKKTYVYIAQGTVKSNTVTVTAR
jgi:hypothetical protein